MCPNTQGSGWPPMVVSHCYCWLLQRTGSFCFSSAMMLSSNDVAGTEPGVSTAILISSTTLDTSASVTAKWQTEFFTSGCVPFWRRQRHTPSQQCSVAMPSTPYAVLTFGSCSGYYGRSVTNTCGWAPATRTVVSISIVLWRMRFVNSCNRPAICTGTSVQGRAGGGQAKRHVNRAPSHFVTYGRKL